MPKSVASNLADYPTCFDKAYAELGLPALPGSVVASQKSVCRSLWARGCSATAVLALLSAFPATSAHAQSAPLPTPQSLVSVCSGVSLPPSVVTGIMDPVLTGIYNPIETNINQTLGVLGGLPGLLGLPSPLSVNVNGLLTTAASGSDIGLTVLSIDGTVVGPTEQCDAAADSYTLDNPAGISIGGNQITGLGDPNEQAQAGEIDSIAIGNRSFTDATSLASIAIGTDATVGPNSGGSIAFGNGATVTVANSVAIGAGASADRGAVTGVSVGEFSVGAPGSERQITNVAAGTQNTDAVNLGQLNALAALVPTDPVEYDDASHSTVTFDGAGGTVLTNVAPGAVTATSTDAINGAQLYGVQTQVDNLQVQVDGIQTQVDTNTTDIANLQTDVTNLQTDVANNTTDITNLQTDVSNLQTDVANNTTTINNLQVQMDGNTTDITNLQTDVANNSTDITNLQTDVTNNTTAITNLNVAVTNGAVGLVQYSNPGTPTVPNGGTPTNDVTLVGAAAGPVGLHNVADGVIASGSTDAVNGGQIFDMFDALPTSIADAVTYDDSTHTSVTLNSGGSSVVVHNVGPGVAPTDAVNVSQMNSAMTSAVNIANAYTDMRIDALDFDLRKARREARSGTAGALAAAGMPQATGEGRTMVAGGVGTYRGKVGFAIGASHRTSNGRGTFKLGVTYDSSQHVGANAGAGIEF